MEKSLPVCDSIDFALASSSAAQCSMLPTVRWHFPVMTLYIAMAAVAAVAANSSPDLKTLLQMASNDAVQFVAEDVFSL